MIYERSWKPTPVHTCGPCPACVRDAAATYDEKARADLAGWLELGSVVHAEASWGSHTSPGEFIVHLRIREKRP